MQQIVFLESGSEESEAKVDDTSAHEDDRKSTNDKKDDKPAKDEEDKKLGKDFFDEVSNSDYDAWELPDDPPSPPAEKHTEKPLSTTAETTEKKARNVKSENILISPESADVPSSSGPNKKKSKSTPLKTRSSRKTTRNIMPDVTDKVKNEPVECESIFWTEQYPKQQKPEIESRKKITKLSHDLLEQPEQSDHLKPKKPNLPSPNHSGKLDERMEMEICSKSQNANRNLHISFERQEDNTQLKVEKTGKEYIPINNLLDEQYGSKNKIEESMLITSRNSFDDQDIQGYAQQTSKSIHQSTTNISISSQFTMDIPLKREDSPKLKFVVRNPSGPFKSSFGALKNRKEGLKCPEQIPQHVDTPALLTNIIPHNLQQQSSQKVDGASVLTENISKSKKGSIKRITDESPIQLEPSGLCHQVLNGPTQWFGSLIKGDLVQFGGKVVVKPMEGRCKNPSTLEMIKNFTELWMVNMLPQAYAERLVDTNDPEKYPMFTMNAVEHNSTSKKNVEEENTLMKWNEIVGVIWLDKAEKLCWLVFPNSQRTCVTLTISPRPNEKFIIIPKRVCVDEILNPSSTQLSENDPLSDYKYLSNELSHTVRLVILSNNYNELPEMCSNASRFAVFGPKDNFEVKEMIDACKGLKVNYDPDFSSGNIDLILIHIQYLNQINYVPRLMELKHKSNCKFHLFGWDLVSPDPVNLVECFPSGCVVTITPKLLLSWARDVIKRIMTINNQQRAINGGDWYIKIHPLLKSCLERTFNKDQSSEAEEALRYLNKHFQMGNFSYFDEEELYFLEGSLEVDSPFVNKLHYMMTRYHNLNVKKLRHVIVIQDESEVEIFCLPIEGVERMTLPEFQSKFGLSK